MKAVQRVLNSQQMGQHSRAFGIILQEKIDNAILERCIDQEIPVVMLITSKHSKNGHYAIAIGYD